MATSPAKRLFQHFRLSSGRRLPQLSANAPMRYKAICFSTLRATTRLPLSQYGDYGTGCIVPMHPKKPNVASSRA
ncbi:hypothetical protein CDO26_18295 (plasmid) [Sinorhizobium meliloti]|nr:hypothetical protein CDO26_18295 [Sinorhizobium meliloti]RVG82525.1 hypothetical protein CN219_21305 [Sinorhizobium meliloti]RVI38422.1 hypothetical protein CN197_04680 [Sinorhizobium meliloti]RVI42180.1 hypothetical protein CN196_22965 [Sinorhizobium meliloti]RVJ25011.1 hypothetical protein CN177_14555 [Sinorhizobium meliloti]